MYRVRQKKCRPKDFWQCFLNEWKFFNKILYLCKITKIYSAISNFDKVMPWAKSSFEFLHFTMSPQNLALRCITCLSSVSSVKNVIFTIQDTLERPVLRHHKILQFFSIFKIAAVRHLWILKFTFLTATHQGRALRHQVIFWGDLSYCCKRYCNFSRF